MVRLSSHILSGCLILQAVAAQRDHILNVVKRKQAHLNWHHVAQQEQERRRRDRMARLQVDVQDDARAVNAGGLLNGMLLQLKIECVDCVKKECPYAHMHMQHHTIL
jgi:hypothetical protein